MAEFEKKDAELTAMLEYQMTISNNFKTIEELGRSAYPVSKS
ncbi:MAG: hypothetical protein U5L09_11195 [Bacteroidales bacterium]|nr:hypothetical protein [Bacteroidales bacterium]